jgi:hypothetical protein
MYHEYKNGNRAGYAKFETFPIWDLPLNHKVNIAYEAATVDLKDVVLIDHHHLEAYNIKTVNYNRDLEAFPLLKRILEKISGEKSIYKSPTDMGVNRASSGIINDKVIQNASHQEIIRRYFRCAVEYALGLVERDILARAELIMERVNAKVEDRKVVIPSRQAAREARKNGKGNEGVFCGAAIELKDGTIITGKNSPLMHASSSLILNASKHLAGLPVNLHLLPKNIIDSLTYLKKEIDIIAPAMAAVVAQGHAVSGPFPADTVFVLGFAQHFDAIVAMYHDQGLPVLKAATFGHGINVTLGLPFIRTSVDHGTALDLAADAGKARGVDPGSLFAAVDLAIELAGRAAGAESPRVARVR